jgi:DNA-binding transcriptional regulator YhcF (GntR family)
MANNDVFVGVNDIANMIGISPSTIKKYYLAIEERGYQFRRNLQGQVMFNEDDLDLFRKLIITKNQPGVTIKQAVEKVLADITDITTFNPKDKKPDVDMTVMMEQFNQLKEMFLTIQKDLHEIKQEQHASKKLIESQQLEKPDYAEMMDQTNKMFKEVMEQLAASQEKKGFWSRLFK